jgi:hypothetical protein
VDADDSLGQYPDQVLRCGLGPRVGPGADDRGALGLGVHVMRRPHDQHDPSFEGFQIELVDLEGDLVLSVRDTGPQVLFGEGVLAPVPVTRITSTFAPPGLSPGIPAGAWARSLSSSATLRCAAGWR